MATVSLEEAQANLTAIIHQLSPGEELVITENNQPVARIISSRVPSGERRLGTMRGTVLYMAPNFDAPLDDFREYTQ